MEMNYILAYAIPQKLKRHQAEDYNVEFRHFTIFGNETRSIDFGSKILFLNEIAEGVTITSEEGNYQPDSDSTPEQTLEFTGVITITNNTATAQQVKFVELSITK